jgi:hypothetical protein
MRSRLTLEVGIAAASILSAIQPASAIVYNSFEFTDVYGNIDSNGNVDWNLSFGTAPGGKIKGTIGFDENDLDGSLSGTNIQATSFVIDSVPSYFQNIWQNTNFGIGNNLVNAGNSASNAFNRTFDYFDNHYSPSNSFTVTNGLITNFKFEERFYLGVPEPNSSINEQYEWVVLGGAENENTLIDPAYLGDFPGNLLEITYRLDAPLFTSPPVTYSDVFVYDYDNNITFAAVPFEFSPGLGILTIGGIWGISRWQKAKKNNKNETIDFTK